MSTIGASPCCMLCSGWLGEADWSKEFTIVCHEHGQIYLGHVHYDEYKILQDISFDGAGEDPEATQVFPWISPTATDCFFIHSSCYHVLLEQTTSQIEVEQLFQLCQALRREGQIKLGCHAQINLHSCLDPHAAIIPSYLATLCTGPYMKAESARCDSRLLELPFEILTMILSYLSPTDLVRLFCTSKIALDYGESFMCRKSRQFHRCVLLPDDEGISKRRLLLVLSLNFLESQSAGLDLRWEVVSRITRLSKYMFNIAIDSRSPTMNASAPMKPVNHAYGLWNSFADLPIDLQAITVYGVRIEGHIYVCGLDFLTRSTHQRVGVHSKLVSRFDVLHDQVDVIFFLVDALGIRNLKLGRSGIKFRHIRWHSDTIPSFGETLLMQNGHAFWKGHVDENHYISRDPEMEELTLSHSGGFTVETLWITENLSGVTFYCDVDLIYGIAIHDSSGTSIAGEAEGFSKYFPIHGPDEVLAEIIFRVHSDDGNPVLTLKTNWDRQ
ncbi:hypothetical protein ASPBRDRAFT_64824, partial [Aspergillus brasiliensis CBS 101740]